MPHPQLEQWQRLFEQKRHALLEEECGKALDIASLEDLQTALRDLTMTYSRTSYPGIIEKLDPGLNHLMSFTNAISSASQYEPVACLVWGSIQAIMQCAYKSSNFVHEVVDVVSEMNDRIPEFQSYFALFPDAIELQYPLQDLFEDYLEFALNIISYIKRESAMNFLSNLWSSKPTQLLERTRDRMQQHFKAFKRGAELVHHRNTLSQHLQIEKKLAASPLTVLQDEPTQDPDKESRFPVSTVHLYQNYSFFGRDEILGAVHNTFHSDQSDQAQTNDQEMAVLTGSPNHQSPACCVLHGLGGVGKTQAALEYTYRHRDTYDGIFWVQAEHPSTLAATYSTIAEKLELTMETGGHDGQNQGRQVKQTWEWLTTTSRRWLLIFDNVEEINDLNAYLPTKTRTQGSVILTTQKPNPYRITNVFKTIPVESFTRDEGSDLLFKHLRRRHKDEDELEMAREISDILGGLPLAIATIGGYILESDCSISEFLPQLRNSSNAWEASAVGPVQQYEKRLENVFEIALKELPEDARAFINVLAFLNPDNTPEELFTSALGCGSLSFLKNKAQLTDIIRLLRRRQLVRRDTSGADPFLSVHRAVQWNVLLDLSKDHDHRWQVFKQAFNLLRKGLPMVSPIDNPEPEKWAQFEKYVPQILNLRTHCLWPEPPVQLPENFAQVLSDMATYMWHAGLMSEGYDALETAESILDDNDVGDENPLRGNIHEHLGIIASFSGVSRREECMSRREKALQARKTAHAEIPNGKITREDEIRLYNVESDMAFGLMQEESFEESESYIEKCHDQYRRWGTPDDIPFEYLKYHHIISYIRMSQNQPVKAIESCNLAAKLGEKCAGVAHPMTQLCRFSLSNHLYLAGETEQALTLSRSVLQTRAKVCGEYNHFTLESHVFCAFLFLETNQLEEAEKHLIACLDRRKRSAWNPEGVARAQYIYSKVLAKLNQLEESGKQLKEAQGVRDRYLKMYAHYIKPDPHDLVVFDQMVCLWAGRFTGSLKQAHPVS